MLLTVFKEKEKNQKHNNIQVLICVVMFIIIFCPVIFISGKELIEQLNILITTENLTEFFVLTGVSVFIFISGFIISKGHITLLHSYHYRNVTDREGYCKEIGKAIMFMGIPFLCSAFLTLFASIHIVSVLCTLVLIVGEATVFIWMFKIQMKYNGGLF